MTHFAAKYGATLLNLSKCDVAAEVRKLTSARQGADVVLEMTGSPKVYPAVFDSLRNEGRVVIVGHAGEMPFDITKWLTLKGATIKGIYGRKVWDTWSDLAALVETKKIDLSGILTHTFGLSEVDEAFTQIQSGAGKVLFLPNP